MCLLPWGLALLYAVVSIVARPSFHLAIFGDISQLCIAALLVAILGVNAFNSHERARWFWFLMTVGSIFWLASQSVWTYYELWQHVAPPSPGIGGVLLFLHLAPMMAALAMLPHRRSAIPPLSALSIGMILTWWLFLYAYLVVPWQYVHAAPDFYNQAFTGLYTIENLVFIGSLALCASRASGAWRRLYVGLFAGSAVYTAGTVLLNHMIDQKNYYTGSPWDLIFLLPICWIAYLAASFRLKPSFAVSDLPERSNNRVGWLTLVALLSVPCLLIWNDVSLVPESVREFRSIAGLTAVVALALLLFAKQYVLAGRLSESLEISQENVSELSKLREQLEEKATLDSMTGLLNRSAAILSLERELARAARDGGRVAALLLDLDHFKSINDSYGHHAGDMAIAFAATCMVQSVRLHDYVGRYGGEEFLIVVSDCDAQLAQEIAERIRGRMDNEVVTFDGNELSITATIGLAISEPGENSESLLRRADAALYMGKQHGRNIVVRSREAIQRAG